MQSDRYKSSFDFCDHSQRQKSWKSQKIFTTAQSLKRETQTLITQHMLHTHMTLTHTTHTHDTHTTHMPHTLRHMNSLEVNNFVCFLFPALIVLRIMEGYWWGFFLVWLRWLFGMKIRLNLICGGVQCEDSVCVFVNIFLCYENVCVSLLEVCFVVGIFLFFFFWLWLVIHKNRRKICMDQHRSAQIF